MATQPPDPRPSGCENPPSPRRGFFLGAAKWETGTAQGDEGAVFRVLLPLLRRDRAAVLARPGALFEVEAIAVLPPK
jgi:hypothetical protein